MATVLTEDTLVLRGEALNKVWGRVVETSLVASAVPEIMPGWPGDKIVSVGQAPKAQIVAEGGQKKGADHNIVSLTAQKTLAQVTVRCSAQAYWASEEYKLRVEELLVNQCARALARAIDLRILHGIDPSSGTSVPGAQGVVLSSSGGGTDPAVQADKDKGVAGAIGAVVGAGHTPTHILLDPEAAWELANKRDAGQLVYPDLTVGGGTHRGIKTLVSTTVSGKPEIAAGKTYAVAGDFSKLALVGFYEIPFEVIKYGDPDGGGDLKGKNQIAFRAELYFGHALVDNRAFSGAKAA